MVLGNLIIEGNGARLTAAKNLPALYVMGDLILRDVTDLQVEGLIAVDRHVYVGRDCVDIQVSGGLFVKGWIFEMVVDSSGQRVDCTLSSAPTWTESGNDRRRV